MKNSAKEKAQSTVTNVLSAVVIAAIVVLFFFFIFPLFFGDFAQSISLSSSEIVARDIAGLISVSGVAPDEIKIEYSPSSTVLYNVTIAERVVTVVLFSSQNEIASAKTAVGNLNEKLILSNIFDIAKTINTITDSSGNKIFQPVYSIDGKSS